MDSDLNWKLKGKVPHIVLKAEITKGVTWQISGRIYYAFDVNSIHLQEI